jgi:hypothetical protein
MYLLDERKEKMRGYYKLSDGIYKNNAVTQNFVSLHLPENREFNTCPQGCWKYSILRQVKFSE